MFDPDLTDPETGSKVLASLPIAPARWGFSLGVLYLLGAILIYLAVAFPPDSLALLLLLLGFGVLSLLGAERARRVRGVVVYLSKDRLWDSTGHELARLENIRSVERGALAFKPSNGFLLRLSRAPGRAWVPGLWWRMGKSVGVGGSTPSGAGKFMAEMVATLLKARDGA